VGSVEAKDRDTSSAAQRASALSEDERHKILLAWNDTAVELPPVCAHDLFEAQVDRTPDAVAVSFAERRLTYRELNQRANQVAHYLRERGVGRESLVGVSLKRGPELVVGLLATWKAGAAYVPLDPAYPADRLAFMVDDAAIRVLLTDSSCRSLYPTIGDRAVILDGDWARFADCSTDNPVASASPADLAYVMYTSGSTGQPKGAMILHRGLVNYLCWAVKAYAVEQGGSVPVHSSISFDLTVTSLYPILLAGGCAELLPEDVGAQNLVAALRRNGNRTLVKITPAHLDLLGQQLAPAELAGMTKTFVIGGENLLAESVEVWRNLAPNTRLINEYGPTETVVGCCVYEVRPEDARTGPIPIGRPIANTQLYVLDADLQPVPVGETGELYIGGAGVARGYLNRPELTQERFLVDRFSGREGARLYKTGDLARYRADGVLEYLGRIDNQVKIRGYRIELGEIEATLAAQPDVQSCAVLSREDTPGNKQLVGYVVLREGATHGVSALSDFLRQRLPEYMVPAQLVLLESMPLTQNGKIDRKALPAFSQVQAAAAESFVAPRTDTERALAEIWAKLLNVARIGIHDDFFELGGHSLLVIKAVSRIRDTLGVELPTEQVFEHSTVAGLAALMARDEGKPGAEPPQEPRRILPRKQDAPCPLSFAQEQFWLLAQMVPDSPAYNIVDVIDLTGPYHGPALRQALGELLRRHEILRSAFVVGQEGLRQVVAPLLDLPMREVDLSGLPESERAAEWARVVREEGRKPFKLAEPPLLRVALVHYSEHEHRLLVVMHHIIGDEWAMGLVQGEVRQMVEAFSRGLPSPLPELPVQYADFACWQRDWYQGDRLEAQLAYWKETLSGAVPVLALPADKPRPPELTFRGATEHFVLPKRSVLEGARALGRQEQATLFMLLEAAFASLLYRYSGQNDLLVGTPISGRTQTETQALVGCFLNTVVLRSRFDDEQTFRSLVRQTRERVLGAFSRAELPFTNLVATLAPGRDPSRTPLFQAMFVLFDPESTSRVSQVSTYQGLDTGTSKVDVTLSMSISDQGLAGEVEYSTDLFEADTIRRMCQHFGVLLEALVGEPDRRIASLPLLTQSEAQKLLHEWNPAATTYPRDLPIGGLIETQARKTPDAVALRYGQTSFTFMELNLRANQLANALQARGVGRGKLVGICLQRSPEIVVAVLAVLKSGAGYVPLDPSFPAERLAYMVEDSRLALVISSSSLANVHGCPRAMTLQIDGDLSEIARQPTDRLPDDGAGVGPRDIAYVLYTSGSTGRPKGVCVPHQAVVNFLTAMAGVPGLQQEDRLLAVTTLSFDIAVLELLLPLCVGAQIVLASREQAIDGEALRGLIEGHGVTAMQATPATWRLLLASGWRGQPRFKALCGGEALPLDLAEALLGRVSELWNMYGPTETTVWSTCGRVSSPRRGITIGRPISNTTIRILDGRMQQCPIGVAGEIYIGGDGLALGYLNRPELTAERFLPDPHGKKGELLYRTGDLGRWRPDGEIECLGRVDFQVKIRGFRIELGEIESALGELPAVQQAVVVAREEDKGDVRLVAYLRLHGGGLDEQALRAHLRRTLPDYMVPQHFMALDAFPTTPNGKIDRKALPAPESRPAAVAVRGPRTSTEQRLAEIWKMLLKRDGFGVDDDFFDLGGHSLLSVTLLAEIEKQLGAKLGLSHILHSPTIAGLAAAVDALVGPRPGVLGDGDGIVAIRPGGPKALFFVYDGLGEVMPYLNLARRMPPEYSVFGLLPRRRAGIPLAHLSVPDMAEYCVRHMRRQQPTGPYTIGGLCAGGVIAFAMAERLEREAQVVQRVILLDSFVAPVKPRRVTAERWERFSAIFKRARQPSSAGTAGGEPAPGPAGVGGEVLHKLKNLFAYEALKLTESASIPLRLRLLEHVLTTGGEWPAWIPPLRIADIYADASERYRPGQVDARLVLVRAGKGDGDDLPAVALVLDPLFGWSGRSRSGLDVIDTPGGHYSMLQKPYVNAFADRLLEAIDPAQQRNAAFSG